MISPNEIKIEKQSTGVYEVSDEEFGLIGRIELSVAGHWWWVIWCDHLTEEFSGMKMTYEEAEEVLREAYSGADRDPCYD